MDHSEVKHLPKVDHTPAELDGASRLLLAAAAYMEQKGHCKGIVEDDQGRVCVIGAFQAAGYSNFGQGAFSIACDRVDKAVGMPLVDWNNAPERVGAEVVAKMRAVAFGG